MTQKPAEVFQEFYARYQYDWSAFVRDVWGAEPDPWQEEVLREACLPGAHLLSIASGKGVGKSALLSWIAVLRLLFKFPQKTMVTSPSKPQMQSVLRPEIHMWIERLPKVLQECLEVQAEVIKLKASPAQSFLTFRTAREDSPESLQGFHSVWTAVLVDEASGMSYSEMEGLLGIMVDPNPTVILCSNPLQSSGYFFDTHRTFDNWKTWTVSVLDSPRRNQAMIDQVLAENGEASNEYRVRIAGQFPLADDDTVIGWGLVEAARTRDIQPTPGAPLIWGVDPARYGDDATAWCERQGNVVLTPTTKWYKLSTMETVGRLKAMWDERPPERRPTLIAVDVIGIGAGVVDRLRELGLPVRGVNVSELPALTAKYKNLRTELWFKARDWLAGMDVRLPADDTLAKQLVQPRYTYASSGQRVLESKDDTKKRMNGRSPDCADAFVLTFAADAATALHGRSPTSGPLRRNLVGVV
jgi:phage terminase large subunit